MSTSLRFFLDKINNHKVATIVVYAMISLLLSISMFISLLNISVQLQATSLIFIAIVLAVLLLVMFILLLAKFKQRPEIVFVLVAIPATCIFGLLMIPNNVPDEAWHFYQVFDIFSGGKEMVVPSVLEDKALPNNFSSLYSALLVSTDYQDTIVIERDMSIYLTHLYIIPGLVTMFTKAIGLNAFVVIYIARLVNAAIFIVVGYICIKQIPIGKTFMLIYLLNPMLIQQQASCSADVITNIFALLFIVFVLKYRFQEQIEIKNVVLVLILFVCMAMSKYAYAPLGLLIFLLLPKVKNKSLRIAIPLATAAVVIAVAVYVIFVYQGDFLKPSLDLIRTPADCIVILLRTIYRFLDWYILSFAGISLGAFNIAIWPPLTYLYLVILLLSLIMNIGEQVTLKSLEKILIWCLVIVTSVLMILVFREWAIIVDKVFDAIQGVQGRYFIPLFVLLLITGISTRSNLVKPNCLLLYAPLCAMILLGSCVQIMRFGLL